MLSSISWYEFLLTAAILLGLYYLVMGCLLFRKEIFNLFSSGTVNPEGILLNTQTGHRPFFNNEMTAATGKEDSHLQGKVHELLEDVKGLCSAAVKAKTVREELMMALQLLLRDYSMLKHLPITTAISEHIIAEAKDTCSITLSDAEMNMLWNG